MYENEREAESYEFHIIILNIRMKIRFPCKMKV